MDVIKLYSGGFPLTTERLQFLQDAYGKAITQLSKVAGAGNTIIDGAVESGGNITDGVIIVNGEVLPFVGGVFDARVAIFETVYDVPYNEDIDDNGELDLKPSDVVRIAKCDPSAGIESFLFTTLTRVGNLQSLQMPIGSIIPFDGDIGAIPAGWELYNMPDQFIMGAGGTASLNDTGGTNSLVIAQANIPSYTINGTSGSVPNHSHGFSNYYYAENGSGGTTHSDGGTLNVGENVYGSSGSDNDNADIYYINDITNGQGGHDHSISLNSGGSGTPIDNRPAFKALNFIRFVGF